MDDDLTCPVCHTEVVTEEDFAGLSHARNIVCGCGARLELCYDEFYDEDIEDAYLHFWFEQKLNP
jgi:hypothetical protein